MYDITSAKWTLITEDTHAMGGPKLIFDHQVTMDVDRQTIYVFGGRVLTGFVIFVLHVLCFQNGMLGSIHIRF